MTLADVARDAAPLLLQLVRDHEAKNADPSCAGPARGVTDGAGSPTSKDAA